MVDSQRRVVIQASGNDATLPWRALQHAKNLRIAAGDDIVIEIVVQSGAVMSLITGHPIAVKLAAGRGEMPGVRVLACRNAMRANDVAEDTLSPGIETVPAGIAHLAYRQWDGWAFVPVP